MSQHRVALTRHSLRTVFTIEAPEFGNIVDALLPFLADDTHLSHEATSEDVVFLAALRLEVERARQAFDDAVALVRREEERQQGL